MTSRFFSTLFLALVIYAMPSVAQVNVAFVDSEYINSQYPEFATMQQQIDRLAEQWSQDLQERQQEIDDLFQEYQARELLYTQDERQRKQEEIMQAEEELNSRRIQYFGPEGELFRQQEQMLRPIQEKVLQAIEVIALAEGYDYVFDRGGDYLFLFADEKHNISDDVLEELGIEVGRTGTGGSSTTLGSGQPQRSQN